jgi:DNA-binding CsgD family transcriptional regulator
VGLGVILAARPHPWPDIILLAGWGFLAAGVTFFAIFGAIVGGLFIQVMAPILLILGGLGLRWGRVDTLLPESIASRLRPQPSADYGSTDLLPKPLVEPLSARELEVLGLVDQGLSNQQIALKLSVATSTVKTHINNIYGKLGVQTRVQALRRARELNLL